MGLLILCVQFCSQSFKKSFLKDVCFAFRATRLRIRYSVEDMERVMFDYDTDWTAHSLVVD